MLFFIVCIIMKLRIQNKKSTTNIIMLLLLYAIKKCIGIIIIIVLHITLMKIWGKCA